jgi:GPI mannosyltransferase 3
VNALSVLRRPYHGLDVPDAATGIRLNARVALALIAVLLLAFLLRIWVAVEFPNAQYSDETFATREAAHRLAYGYGLINPDWQEGIRSWVFPAFLAGVMRATDWLGAGSSGYVAGIIVVLALMSLTVVWFSFMWAYRTSGITAGLIAAGASAVWYEFIYYGPKAYYEIVAAHVLLPGLYLGQFGERIPERRRLFLSGLFCGLAVALRPPLAPAVVFAAAAFSLKNPRVRLPAIAAGILAPIALFGIVDAFTWSYPFHSFIRFFGINVMERVKLDSWAIAHQWIRPWYWFLPVLALRLGPMALFALLGARRSPFLGWVALVILLTHSVVGHKEFRFVYPIIPIAVTLAALGIADVLSALSARLPALRSATTAVIAGLAVCLCSSALLAWFFPVWSRFSGNLIAFQELSRDARVCGLALVGEEVDPVISGGYTYLHRNIPMFYFRAAGGAHMNRLAPSFNAIVTGRPLHYAGFESVRCWNGTCLYRRQGSCTASPGDAIRFIPVPWQATDP